MPITSCGAHEGPSAHAPRAEGLTIVLYDRFLPQANVLALDNARADPQGRTRREGLCINLLCTACGMTTTHQGQPDAVSVTGRWRERIMGPVFAFAGGSIIFIVVIIAFFFAVVYGFYTYKGSAINAHPADGLDGAPGAEAPSDPAGKSQIPDDPDRPDNEGSIPTHGTR